MKLDLQATPEEVMRAVDALRDFGHVHGVPENEIFGLALVLEECGSNIVNHALRKDPCRKFQVTFERSANAVTIELRDPGPEFDPTQARVYECAPNGAEKESGGWGILLVRRYADEIRYLREADENVLRLTKQLSGRPGKKSIFHNQQEQEQPITKLKNNVMPLEIQIQKDISPGATGAITVKLNGSLDTATAPELERQLAPVLSGTVQDIVFDLAGLNFISSAGLRVFSNTRKQLKERGGQASFIHMQPQIQEVFEIMKALPGVAIFKDVAELDRYLAARQRSHRSS